MTHFRPIQASAILLLTLLAMLGTLAVLSGCFDDRTAGGTGTATENVLTARVLSSDGIPAAGASVTLRPMGYVPEAIGISESSGPGSRLEATTGPDGRFTIRKPSAGSYFVECARDSQVLWVENIRLAAAESRNLGDLRMDTAAGIAGGANMVSAGGENLWAGFPGTEHFSRLDASFRFVLSGFPADRRDFHLYRLRPAGDWQQIRVHGWIPLEGKMMPLPTIQLSDPASMDTAVDLSSVPAPAFCPETGPDTLLQDRTAALSIQTLRLRGVLATNPPQWIELDPCKGSWRSLVPLPPTALGAASSFATRMGDFTLVSGGSIYFRKILAVESPAGASFAGVSGVVNRLGQFHVLYGKPAAYAIFPDTSFLHGAAPAPSYPLPGAPDSLAGIAYLGTVLYALASQAALAPVYSCNTTTQASRVEGLGLPAGTPTRILALVKASDTALWLLDENSRLLLWDAAQARVVKIWQVQAAGSLRTLARYPD